MGPLNEHKKNPKAFKKLPGISVHKGAVRNLLHDRNHPLDANGFLLYSLAVVCYEDVFWLKAVAPTMDSAVWVCCRSGSGSRETWTHSGMVTVPPSKSAMITSNWKTTHHTSRYEQHISSLSRAACYRIIGCIGRSWGISVWNQNTAGHFHQMLISLFLPSWCADSNYYYQILQSLYRDWS